MSAAGKAVVGFAVFLSMFIRSR